jgi:Anti-sigma-K factor rskA
VSTDDDQRGAYLAGEAAEALATSERASLDEVRSLLAAPATWAEPAPDLEDRVVDAIRNEAPPRLASRPSRSRYPSWPRFTLALVATGAAVVVLALIVNNRGPAPQQFTMKLTGTSLAPGAYGDATLTKTGSGWQIQLAASGLRHLDNGSYYEAWLKNAAGILVPVGTFNDGRHVTLWAGVPPTSFPTLTVTQQRANGNPSSSGRRVLSGTISVRR